jgi:hypothetical protein
VLQGIKKILRIPELAKKRLRAFDEQMFQTLVLDTWSDETKVKFLDAGDVVLKMKMGVTSPMISPATLPVLECLCRGLLGHKNCKTNSIAKRGGRKNGSCPHYSTLPLFISQ